MAQPEIRTFVFSFNRGSFLENAVRSVRDCFPSTDITIVDDGSSDPQTLETLHELARDVRVMSFTRRPSARLGGLYRNMQAALEATSPDDILLFMQDDTQITRICGPEDVAYIHDYFASVKDAMFLLPVFLKGRDIPLGFSTVALGRDFPAYTWASGLGIGEYFSAMMIGHSGRLKRANWTFGATERVNAQQAAAMGLPRAGYMRNPFIMWLPEVPIYRGGRRTAAMALREIFVKRQVNRFRYMTPVELLGFLQRDDSDLPIAERFLTTERPTRVTPFEYNLADVADLWGRGHYWELRLRRKLGSGV